MPEGLVSTPSDLMSSVPSDLFSSATAEDFGGDGAQETFDGAEETPVEEEAQEPEPVEELDAEQPEEETEAELPEEPAEPTADDLPEGVRRGKDRNGKDGLWLTPQRYESFHGHHQLVQQTADKWGEPVTPEGLDVRNRAFIGQEKLYGDLLSGDPEAQARVLSHFFKEGAREVQEGAVGADPIVSLANTFYSTLRDSHPDAYANLRLQAAKDLIQELYEEAGQSGNRNLWLSAGHLASTLKQPFRSTDEFATFAQQQADPMTALQRRNQELEQQLNGRTANGHAAQYDQWRVATGQAVKTAILDNAIRPALADTEKAWEKFPDAYNDLVVDRLHSAVKATIEADKGFSERIKLLNQQANRATSAQKRADIGEQIKQAYVNRASVAVNAHKGKIRDDAARIFKERNDATHARRQAAPQRGPRGNAGPVPQSIPSSVGKAGGAFSVDQAMKDMARLFG